MIAQEESPRNHQAADTPLLRPRLGWLSGLTLLALAIAQLVGIPTSDPLLSEAGSHFWLAAMWAGWSAAVWICIQPPLTGWRIVAAGVWLAWHCGIMEMARQQPLERYVIMFGGFGVLQATAAILLRLPRWEIQPPQSTSAAPRPGQFGIFSILVLMTAVAGVLLAVRRYGDAGGEQFLSGAVFALLLLTLIAAIAIAAATARRWGAALLPLLILVAAASASVMASQEMAAGGADFGHYWRVYFSIEAIFGLLVYAVGVCGRLDATVPAPLELAPRDRS